MQKIYSFLSKKFKILGLVTIAICVILLTGCSSANQTGQANLPQLPTVTPLAGSLTATTSNAPSATNAPPPTNTAQPTVAATNTAQPAPATANPPPAATVPVTVTVITVTTPQPTTGAVTPVQIEGELQRIINQNNITIIVINNVQYILPPELVKKLGKDLRQGNRFRLIGIRLDNGTNVTTSIVVFADNKGKDDEDDDNKDKDKGNNGNGKK